MPCPETAAYPWLHNCRFHHQPQSGHLRHFEPGSSGAMVRHRNNLPYVRSRPGVQFQEAYGRRQPGHRDGAEQVCRSVRHRFPDRAGIGLDHDGKHFPGRPAFNVVHSGSHKDIRGFWPQERTIRRHRIRHPGRRGYDCHPSDGAALDPGRFKQFLGRGDASQLRQTGVLPCTLVCSGHLCNPDPPEEDRQVPER